MQAKCEILRKVTAGVDKVEILREYNISDNTYYNVIKNESEIINEVKKPHDKRRKVFRQVANKNLDSAVIEWFQQKRVQGDPISCPLVREKALILNEKLNGSKDFKHP